ncbi:MAG: type secretion protein IcmF [Enterovirga sp.]|jgi:type VI secretion system protein ImpL|nr:type secretion protein IcmF [Enterovirga sp.]
MTWKTWLRYACIVVGALALAALIWFAGPLIAFGRIRPFDGFWLPFGLCLGVLLLAFGYVGFDIWRRRRAARAIEDALSEAEGPSDDSDVLSGAMKDALSTLKKARGAKGDYLYELPWYIIIGPPGSGKTTALVNSGLKFPLNKSGSPEAVAGIGGTRYCDWWFTEDAVLIDTAGRYTTQDSDAKSDRASWISFLDLLKTNRPKQPINGVIIAISLDDLLTGTEEELTAHSNAIRKRLLELHERLNVDFPVYALFTKADLVAGFMEFFGNMSESDRRMVWGHTFQTNDKTRNMIAEVPPEFDALIERLNQWLPDRLQDEPTPTSRVVLFGFPSQVASAKKHVVEFLNRIFEPTRYHANATLRGFYFASGTQQGTPIDQLIGALSRSFGSEDISAGSYSGTGKSFFLTDLLKKVIIGEAGWVSTNRAAVRRSNILRVASYGGLAVVCATLVGLWWTSYLRNSQLVQQSNTGLNKYRGEATDVLRESVVADRNFAKVLPLLNTLRYLPTGYAVRDDGTPVLATMGLSQRERLQSAAETSYHTALERMFRSRLIFRMEEQLEANRNNPGFIYEALKVYLMLGGRPEAPPDRELILTWMRRDWAETLYPGAGFSRGRELLEQHLVALLDLEDGPPIVSINQSLVEDCQRTLARLSVAERAYELLKSQARVATQRDWTVLKAGGPDASIVFEVAGGGDLDSVRVPFFFTYDGFFEAFIDRFGDVAENVDRDRWVLGAAGQQQAYTAQYGSLFADLLKTYAREFVPAWTQALGKLKLKPMAADKPRYTALQAVSAPTSPLKQIIESMRDETRLTRERPGTARGEPGKPGGTGGGMDPRTAARARTILTDAGVRQAEQSMQGLVPSSLQYPASQLARLAAEAALGSAGSGGGGAGGGGARTSGDRFATPAAEAPGANIEASFKQFHLLLEGDPGRRTIDALIQNLNELKNSALEATNPSTAQQANVTLVTQTRNLRSLASRFPPPFEPMIRQVAGDFEGSATGAAVSQLQQMLADQVTRDCQQIVTNRYPFVRGSERDVPIADFARLFAPNGILDKFFAANLAARADRSRPVWAWRPEDQIGRGLSPAALREFQRASEIRDAFFGAGGNMPMVNLAVTPLTLSGDMARAKLDIDGTTVVTQQGINTASKVTWPGPSGIGRTVIYIETGGGGGFFGGSTPVQQQILTEKTGTWSLYRMLDSGSVLKQGDAVVATFVAGGREVSYRFNVTSILNPLVLPALREFKCPTGI